jgi:superfamily II DNA or RNA helicase
VAITLFPDQQQALDAVLREYRAMPIGGKALVVAPTAWGKTIFFSFLARELGSDGNVLIIAHRDELLNQAREKYLMIDPTAIVGKVGGGAHEYGAPITVAGIDTISQPGHLKNLHRFGYKLVIYDEVHHAPAPKYQKVMTVLKDAFRVGVTATAKRLDNKSLFPHFGVPVFSMDIKEAIQKHRLCNVRAQAIKTEVDLAEIGSSKNSDGDTDFNEEELDKAVNTPERNKLIVKKYQEYAEGKRAVAFCVTVAHATALAFAFNEAGIAAAVISGETSLSERKRLFDAYRAGEILVLTNVMVLTEGWDEPLCEVAIMARPTQSWGLFVQCIGRILRLAPGKLCALILDITDNSLRLRLTPIKFTTAVGIQAKNGETLLDALDREEDEKAEKVAGEKRALIRKLNETRNTDKEIDLFALPEWQQKENGMFVMEIGLEKHRIAIVPCKSMGFAQLYEVWARLAPGFSGQKWLSAQTLDWCLQFAEKRARQMIEAPQATKLLDRTEVWRQDSITPGQMKMLKWYRLGWGEGTEIQTKGQASDAIETHKQGIEERKAKKAARMKERIEA